VATIKHNQIFRSDEFEHVAEADCFLNADIEYNYTSIIVNRYSLKGQYLHSALN